MKIAGKDFGFYWKIIEFPFYLLLLWVVASFVVSFVNFSLYLSIFSGYSGWIVSIAVFGIVGWVAVKDHKAKVSESAWCGAVLGVIIGFIGAVLGIVMAYAVPGLVDFSLQAALSQGAQVSRDMISTMVIIGSFVGLVTGPLFNGLIGAGIAALSGFIAKKV